MTKKTRYAVLLLALISALLLCLAACGGSPSDTERPSDVGYDTVETLDVWVHIDERGNASWDALPGAAGGYHFVYYNENGQIDPIEGHCHTYEPRDVSIMPDWGIRVWPLDDKGNAFGVFESAIYRPEPIGGDAEGGDDIGGTTWTPPAEIDFEVHVDENGFATWDKVEGVERYELSYYCIGRNGEPVNSSSDVLVENGGVQLVNGYGLEVRAVVFDGQFENFVARQSAIYGDPSAAHPYGYDIGTMNEKFPYRWEHMLKYDLISSIREESVKVASDGSVTFEALMPQGELVRYYGHGIKIEDGKLLFSANGFLTSLDAIGRIFAIEVIYAEKAEGMVDIFASGGYTFTDATSVDSYLDLTYTNGFAEHTAGAVVPFVEDGSTRTSYDARMVYDMMEYQPNFASLRANPYSDHPFALSELYFYYLDDIFTTDVYAAYLDNQFYGTYLEGDAYDASREISKHTQANVDNFYLIVVPDVVGRISPPKTGEWISENVNGRGIYTVNRPMIEIGALRDADGRVLDKSAATVSVGCTLDVSIGDSACRVSINVLPKYHDANTLHELVPYAYPDATGTIEPLVIPIRWQDDPADMEDVYALFAAELGRITDESGQVTDHSDVLLEREGRVSLSRYFDVASYGKLNVQSFMTKWYEVPHTFAEMQYMGADMLFMDNMLRWLYKTYPDMDWSRFDQDGNGYFDSVIMLNAGDTGDEYMIMSFGGGVMTQYTYTSDRVSEDGSLQINCFTNANIGLFDHYVLIHEFGHNLGLIDYYDVGYTGADAVGRFDMQSGNRGDWNAYSKYAAGWLTPEIVTDLAKGESVEIEIGASALSGDAIVIPGASSDYNGTPFGEYILIDLFAARGNNEIGVEEYGLGGETGVRIYHVNTTMEGRELMVDGKDELYPIGTPHMGNNYKENGRYHIELIQAGKDNTFTDLANLRTSLCADDLFKAGDSFTVEAFGEFFAGGRLDDGTAFGYRIDVVRITEGEHPTATVCITAQ